MRLAKLKDAAPSTAPIEQLIPRIGDRFLAMVRVLERTAGRDPQRARLALFDALDEPRLAARRRCSGRWASGPGAKPVPIVCFNLGSLRNLTFHGDGPSEECLAMIQLGSQKAHLRQKGIAFCGLKLKLEVQPPNVFIVPPCVYTFLCNLERIVRC